MTSVAIMHSGTAERRAPRGSAFTRARRAILRVPLLWKILGANVVLVAGMLIAHFVMPVIPTVVEVVTLLGLSFAATGGLVWLALRPIAMLESTAAKVSAGDFSARAPESEIADREMRRLTSTMNRLLDRVEGDRARIHYLAGRGVRARDIERQAVASELRESFAQTLAGIAMQLSAAQRVNTDPALAASLEATRGMVEDLTEEMRSVAETLYPGTLVEFGLVNAIEALARRVSRRSAGALRVTVEGDMASLRLPPQAAGALYRVADEAVRNVEQHGQARNVRIILRTNGYTTLEIEDDGRGIDMRMNDPLQAGLGLFSAKAVLALSGGELQISSGPGLGTRVTARVPVEHPAQPETSE